MVDVLDGGPVYVQEELRLDGSAEEIYTHATYLSAQMIRWIIEHQPEPRPQEGEPTIFKRRSPSESRIPSMASLEALYDFIRMLDAEGYPHAFLEHESFRYEFRRATLSGGHITADVKIVPIEGPSS
jgi:methionyl-tRNA formyltransferase